jgi:hypothetical protein
VQEGARPISAISRALDHAHMMRLRTPRRCSHDHSAFEEATCDPETLCRVADLATVLEMAPDFLKKGVCNSKLKLNCDAIPGKGLRSESHCLPCVGAHMLVRVHMCIPAFVCKQVCTAASKSVCVRNRRQVCTTTAAGTCAAKQQQQRADKLQKIHVWFHGLVPCIGM